MMKSIIGTVLKCFSIEMDGLFFVMIWEKDLEDMRFEKALNVYQST